MRTIVLIAHDIRSTHNVGALLRTAECMGVQKVYLTGYTPYPATANDQRLPHITRKLEKDIQKTALGAHQTIAWEYVEDAVDVLTDLAARGFRIMALEQHDRSTPLPAYNPPQDVALLLGREVEGVDEQLLGRCDDILEIPQFGQKESLNVVQAAAMGLYHLRFAP